MPENNLVADFEEAYQNLQFQPLITPEDLEKFQVPYREEVTARLKQYELFRLTTRLVCVRI